MAKKQLGRTTRKALPKRTPRHAKIMAAHSMKTPSIASRWLRLHHRRHTAKHLGHEHTSYRALAVVLIACALTLFAIQHVSADAYDVTAAVMAPLPPAATPVITSPDDNTTITTSTVEVSGTCPVVVPALIVEILRDDQVIGSTVCQTTGTFTVQVSLVFGANTLLPRFVTITGQASGFGAPIRLIFQPGTSNSPIDLATPATHDNTFRLKADKEYISYTADEEVAINIELIGGTAPYELELDWGDGYVERITVRRSGQRQIVHTYKTSRPVIIRLSAKDKNGQVYVLQLAAQSLGYRPPAAPIATFIEVPAYGARTIYVAWIVYATSVGMLVGAWLHARHQQLQLAPVNYRSSGAKGRRNGQR